MSCMFVKNVGRERKFREEKWKEKMQESTSGETDEKQTIELWLRLSKVSNLRLTSRRLTTIENIARAGDIQIWPPPSVTEEGNRKKVKGCNSATNPAEGRGLEQGLGHMAETREEKPLLQSKIENFVIRGRQKLQRTQASSINPGCDRKNSIFV